MSHIVTNPVSRQSKILYLGMDEGTENPKRSYAVWAKVDGELRIIGQGEDLENILPISVSDEGINVNFEGDSKDILNHPDSSSGHTLSLTGIVDLHYVDPEIERFFDELREEVEGEKARLERFFEHIGRELIQPAILEIKQSLMRMNWDSHRTHINPYSKKISKIKVNGKYENKGRSSAQYFTSLKAVRKQNTSSVK